MNLPSIAFRPCTREDLPTLAGWLAQPHVAQWWQGTQTWQRYRQGTWRALEKAGYRRCWAGELVSDDPSDEGPMYLYRCERPATVG